MVFWGNEDEFTSTGGSSSLRRGGCVVSCAEGGASERASVLVRGEETILAGGAVGGVAIEEGGV